jgi:hypothetical protein
MFTNDLTVTILGTIGGVFLFSKNKKKRQEKEAEDEYKNNLLCRFVQDGIGKNIGESVAITDDVLIVKSGKKYLGIPLKHIELAEKTLLVKGLIEQDKAEIMGEKWRHESLREIDNNERKKD